MGSDTCGVIILGTGPAGLQAAIHAARSKVSVLALGKQHKSILYVAHIEDFCCLSKVDGETLLKDGRAQTEPYSPS
jgi:thioredoxin reductase (NADPH)